MSLAVLDTLILLFIAYEVYRLRMVQEDRPKPSLMATLGFGGFLAGAVIAAVLLKHL